MKQAILNYKAVDQFTFVAGFPSSDMAKCVQSVQEFVQDSFVPMVAVLCSEDADRVTRKNNLNFAELLRPFCRLTSEGKSSFLTLQLTMTLYCQ